MNRYILIVVLICLSITGCGSNLTLTTNTVVTDPSPSPSNNSVQSIVNNYNDYLVSEGNDPITQGLKCTLYNVPNMPSLPCILSSSISGCTTLASTSGYANIGSWTYTGDIDQSDQTGTNGFNLLPTELQSLYPNDFEVICTGYFVNTDYNYHVFDVASDDGSLIYINGSLVVNNDGQHSTINVSSEKYLEAQVYSFELEYFQVQGYVNLVVDMDGSPLPATNLWH